MLSPSPLITSTDSTSNAQTDNITSSQSITAPSTPPLPTSKVPNQSTPKSIEKLKIRVGEPIQKLKITPEKLGRNVAKMLGRDSPEKLEKKLKKSERRAKEDDLIRREAIKVRIVNPKSRKHLHVKKEKLAKTNASKNIPKDSSILPSSKNDTAKLKQSGDDNTTPGDISAPADNSESRRKYSIFKSRNSMGRPSQVRFTDPTVGKDLCIRDGPATVLSGRGSVGVGSEKMRIK